MWKIKNILTEKMKTERLKEYKKNQKLEKEKVKVKKKVDNTINW